MHKPIHIAGPTASGKSALALGLARRFGGAVINADSQQIYRDWRILPARPTPSDEAQASHFLYDHVPLEAKYSFGAWFTDFGAALEDCRTHALTPIIAGGTGRYFKALTTGLSHSPAFVSQSTKVAGWNRRFCEADGEQDGTYPIGRRQCTTLTRI